MPVARLASLALVLLVLATPFTLRAGYKPGLGWPEVTTPIYYPANLAD